MQNSAQMVNGGKQDPNDRVLLHFQYRQRRHVFAWAVIIISGLATIFLWWYSWLVGLFVIGVIYFPRRVSLDASDFQNSEVFSAAAERIKNFGYAEHFNHASSLIICLQTSFKGVTATTPFLVFYGQSGFLIITPVRYWSEIDHIYSTGKTRNLAAKRFLYDDKVLQPATEEKVIKETWEHATKSFDRDFRFKENKKMYLVHRYGVEIRLENGINWELALPTEQNCDDFISDFSNIGGLSPVLPRTAEPHALLDLMHALDKTIDTLAKHTDDHLRGTEEGAKQSISAVANTVLEVGPLLSELDALVGLSSVKEEIKDLIAIAHVNAERKRRGLSVPPLTYHMGFSGNPGTGKTTVARMLGRIYRALGLLPSDKYKEVTRSDLVAAYLGQTAIKVHEVVQQSIGGVLFIDEAYALAPKGSDGSIGDPYGDEAIATLVKEMEDHREELVVIAAGYTKEMDRFLSSNPGLRSRVRKVIEFPDYTEAELFCILGKFAAAIQMSLDGDTAQAARNRIADIVAAKDPDFANARTMRNLFDEAYTRYTRRMESHSNVDTRTLSRLEPIDFEPGPQSTSRPMKGVPI